MEMPLRICLTLTKRCHSVDVVWHGGWCRTRTKDLCNIFVNSLFSQNRGDLRTKISRGFIKTRTPLPLLFTARFRICSSCTSKSLLCLHRAFMGGDLYLYCAINKRLCSLMGLFRMCNTSMKVNDDNNTRLYLSAIWRYWWTGLGFCVWFKIPRTEYYHISDTGSAPSAGNTQSEITCSGALCLKPRTKLCFL